jgi:hypothetical protein
VRQADILSAFLLLSSGVQLRWAHRLESLCSGSLYAEAGGEVGAVYLSQGPGIGSKNFALPIALHRPFRLALLIESADAFTRFGRSTRLQMVLQCPLEIVFH